ncbi:MAG: flavodoxin domain-containing protein [Anaerolineae bacterium]|nr:flavodoxin domain-containing protein [Anaerolineae bacterium]
MMLNKILIAYGTRYGSTQEVAERVAATLRESGADVDVRPAREVRSLDDYRAVVLGAPLYIGKWHEEAHRFVDIHRNQLVQRPVAIFGLGPLSTDAKEMEGSRAQLDKELAQYAWLKPVAVEMFVGKYEPAKLSFAHRLLAAVPASPLHGLSASDNRDWDAIRAWATGLPVTAP